MYVGIVLIFSIKTYAKMYSNYCNYIFNIKLQ